MHIVSATALPACLVATTITASAQEDSPFTNHGVAADVSRHHGAAATVDGDGNRVLLAWLHSVGDISKIAVNVETGETTQFDPAGPPAGCGGPFLSLRTSRNLWYTHSSGYFYEFDPGQMDFRFVQAVDPRRCSMSGFEDPSGVVWLALYPTAELLSFNPDTRELTNHGSLNEETWPQYPQRGLAMDEAGWLYTGIGNVAGQVVGFNPANGEIRRYVAEEDRALGSGRVYLGTDGRVYATAPNWGWHVMSAGKATPTETGRAGDVMLHGGRASASDGRPMLSFPDGSRISRLDIEGRSLTVRETDATERTVEFDYVSGGSLVVGLVSGPENQVYGVTGRPNYFFQFNPDTEEISRYPLWGGRWNAMTMLRNRPFGGIYTGGWLVTFDPAQQLNPGDMPESNPRRFRGAEPHINRPAVLIAHPDGRHMIMGGTPGYGRTGGGLFIYDLETGESTVLTHEQLLENLSTCSLVALSDGNLVGGTTVAAGTGGVVRASEAELYVFDWERREIVWREVILPGRATLTDMVLGPDGLVYGVAGDSTLFVFDPAARELVHEENLAAAYGAPGGSQSPRMMTFGPDGNVYALFRRALVRICPESLQHVKLADTPVGVGAGIALVDGRLYFGSGARLWSYQLPE